MPPQPCGGATTIHRGTGPMRSRALTTVSILLVATALVACTGSGGSASPSAAGSTAASSSASASEAASPSAAATAASTATVEAKPVGSLGTVLVDGASGKTVETTYSVG